jgi:hypothetical protein
MGRPTLYSPERHHSIVAAVRAGSFAWIAAEANGVSRFTFKKWMRKGERTRREPYRTFASDIRQALPIPRKMLWTSEPESGTKSPWERARRRSSRPCRTLRRCRRSGRTWGRSDACRERGWPRAFVSGIDSSTHSDDPAFRLV